jgi:D-alanyl-lipoteichoic acid acyltransferase DltB (MBOAT superfamily)
MIFSSLIFLYAFLLITFILYFIISNRAYRNFILFAVSLVFYGWGEPKYILVMLASILTAYIFGFFIEKYRTPINEKPRFISRCR